MEARLASPLGALPGLDPGADPLGEFQGFLAGLPLNSLRLTVEDGLLVIRGGAERFILVTALLKGSAFGTLIID